MRNRRRVARYVRSLLILGAICSVSMAQGEGDDEENREALHRGGECSMQAIIAVEAADALEQLDEFYRVLKIHGIMGTPIRSRADFEHRVSQFAVPDEMRAQNTMFRGLVRDHLVNNRNLNPHDVVKEMYHYFGHELPQNQFFPKIKNIGIDKTLVWSMSNGLFTMGTGALHAPNTSGFVHRRGDKMFFLAARIEDELYLYLYHFEERILGRQGRLGVFEATPPHRPIGQPAHIAVLWDYAESNGVRLIPPVDTSP